MQRRGSRLVVFLSTLALVLNSPGISQAFFCNCFKKWCARVGYYQPTYTAAYAPCAGTICQYVPITAYRQAVVNVPVTTYRPVCSTDPCSGCTVSCLRPEVSYRPAIQGVPYTTYRLVYSNPVVLAPPPTVRYCAPCSTCYAAPAGCAAPATGGCCGAPNAGTYAPTTAGVVTNAPTLSGYAPTTTYGDAPPAAGAYTVPSAPPISSTYAGGSVAPPAGSTYAPAPTPAAAAPASAPYEAGPAGEAPSTFAQPTPQASLAPIEPAAPTAGPTPAEPHQAGAAPAASPVAPGTFAPLPGVGAAPGSIGPAAPVPAIPQGNTGRAVDPAAGGGLSPMPMGTGVVPRSDEAAGPQLNDPGARTTWNYSPRATGYRGGAAMHTAAHRAAQDWQAAPVSRPAGSDTPAAPAPSTPGGAGGGWRSSAR